jgi:hypothetical protein
MTLPVGMICGWNSIRKIFVAQSLWSKQSFLCYAPRSLCAYSRTSLKLALAVPQPPSSANAIASFTVAIASYNDRNYIFRFRNRIFN